MTLIQFRQEFYSQLEAIYPETEIAGIYGLLLEEYMGITRVEAALRAQEVLTGSELNLLQRALERLLKQEPIQYILGYAYFYGNKFNVNKNVLIPRPETELAVEKAIEAIKKNRYKKILDIGTGSGAIAITIAKAISDVFVTAVDISVDALEVARCNAKVLELENIEFKVSDMLSNVDGKYDLIISNPPYIAYDEIDDIDEIVYQNEPHLALFASENGVYYYKEIIRNLKNYLNENGMVVFEIGQKQGQIIKDYALSLYPCVDVKIIKDYNSLDRIVIIKG